MFQHEKLGITIPQQEHARLAGIISSHWGNNSFDLPPFALNHLVKGITFHHTGYGNYDTVAFRGLSEEQLIEVFERDVAYDFVDVEAELVNLFHHLRLIRNRNAQQKSDQFLNLQQRVEEMIKERLRRTPQTEDDFTWSNRISHFSDRVSFNFSFGRVVSEPEITVFPKKNQLEAVTIKHEITDNGEIYVGPWPFSVPNFKGFIIGYESSSYPNKLAPYILEYSVEPLK